VKAKLHKAQVKRLHTFEIKGGEPFRISMPGNPPLEHNGKRTLWQYVGTDDQAKDIEINIGLLCEVTRYCEGQTQELKTGRGLT
jgi:hypothetical protein